MPLHIDAWPILGLALALGLSHGADPDHLTAIDGLIRAFAERHPTLSRWIGALFPLGHSCSVLTIAALIAFAASCRYRGVPCGIASECDMMPANVGSCGHARCLACEVWDLHLDL